MFDATFEVYPEVKIGDLSGVEVERVTSEVTEAAIDRTVEILRKQRRTFTQRPAAEPAADGEPRDHRLRRQDRRRADSPAARPRTSSSSSARAACSRSSRRPSAA